VFLSYCHWLWCPVYCYSWFCKFIIIFILDWIIIIIIIITIIRVFTILLSILRNIIPFDDLVFT
jgi:hypothetical protein